MKRSLLSVTKNSNQNHAIYTNSKYPPQIDRKLKESEERNEKFQKHQKSINFYTTER